MKTNYCFALAKTLGSTCIKLQNHYYDALVLNNWKCALNMYIAVEDHWAP